MAASSCFIRQYRCAVYLNNAATTFLARGDYLDAYLSSKECLSLIESIVRPSESCDTSTGSAVLQESFLRSNADLSRTIQLVDKRLATAHTKTNKSNIPMEILCYDGSLDSQRTLMELQSCWNSRDIAMPVWISDVIVDEIDEIDELQRNVTEIIPAIVLLNYALSYLCYYKCSKSKSAFAGSLRLLQMSAEVLCIHGKKSSYAAASIDKDLNFTEGRLFVVMAILSNMKCVLLGTEKSYLVPCHNTSRCSLTSISQLPSKVLAHEIMEDLADLQKLCDEWIAHSRSLYIESLYCVPNAGAA